MKEITYITRIRTNGEYRELSQEEAKKLLQERIENTLQGLNYKKSCRIGSRKEDKPCEENI